MLQANSKLSKASATFACGILFAVEGIGCTNRRFDSRKKLRFPGCNKFGAGETKLIMKMNDLLLDEAVNEKDEKKIEEENELAVVEEDEKHEVLGR